MTKVLKSSNASVPEWRYWLSAVLEAVRSVLMVVLALCLMVSMSMTRLSFCWSFLGGGLMVVGLWECLRGRRSEEEEEEEILREGKLVVVAAFIMEVNLWYVVVQRVEFFITYPHLFLSNFVTIHLLD